MKSNIKVGDPVYTLGVASKLSGIPPHSIRQYIEKGLVIPFRTETKRHLFSEIDILRLKSIKKYINSGLNIAGLKALYAQVHGSMINSCVSDNCENCAAFVSSNLPCWVANKDNVKCLNKDCRTCEVYMMADPVEDLKEYFFKLKTN